MTTANEAINAYLALSVNNLKALKGNNYRHATQLLGAL